MGSGSATPGVDLRLASEGAGPAVSGLRGAAAAAVSCCGHGCGRWLFDGRPGQAAKVGSVCMF
jgi:hypothetical protein